MAFTQNDMSNFNQELRRKQEDHFDRAQKKAIVEATLIRDRKIFSFKREFFLTVAAREASSMAVEEANARADEVIAILFPAVTQENVDEYLIRA